MNFKKNKFRNNAKIYIAGHHGLVGSAIWNNLEKRGYHNLVGRSHKELDLIDQYAVEKFFGEVKSDTMNFTVYMNRFNIFYGNKKQVVNLV